MLKMFLSVLFLVATSAASAQQQPVQISLDYYVERVQQSDMRAAQLMHERDTLKRQVEMLTQKLGEARKPKEEPKQ